MSCGGGGCGGGFSTGSNGLGNSEKFKESDYPDYNWPPVLSFLWNLFGFTLLIGLVSFLFWINRESDQSRRMQPQELLPESSVELASKTSSGAEKS